jgi:aminoglycoside 6'-N-acetyltransferase
MSLSLPVATERLLLRRLAESDLEAFHAYRNDPEVTRYQSWDSMPRAAAESFLRKQAKAHLGVPGRWCQVAIALDGELIGDVGICIRDDRGSAEIGFTLARPHQGRGYAWEAVSRLIEMLFDTTPIARVQAVTDTRNLASIKLLGRLGFRLARTVDNVFKGAGCQEHVFELSRPTPSRWA